MNLQQYLGKNIRVTLDGHVLEGRCHTFTGTRYWRGIIWWNNNRNKYPYVGFNESVIKDIEVI